WELNLIQVPENVAMGGVPYASAAHVTDILTSTFNTLYQESEREPRVMQYCMHPKISGVPYRARGLDAIIRHMQSHDGVRFMTMEEVARLCIWAARERPTGAGKPPWRPFLKNGSNILTP